MTLLTVAFETKPNVTLIVDFITIFTIALYLLASLPAVK